MRIPQYDADLRRGGSLLRELADLILEDVQVRYMSSAWLWRQA